MKARTARGRAMARVALAGNPSDGYGGAVLALTLAEFAAEAAAEPAERDERPDGGIGDLAGAALATLRRHSGGPESAVRIGCATTIPARVGLGGSSAIVIATLRALCALEGIKLTADELAAIAWEAETEELGVAAGPQDRYVQAHEGLVLMDFSGAPSVTPLELASLPPLFVAYRADAGEPSGVPHSDLRRRAAGVSPAMRELARLAQDAAAALRAGDVAALGACMDGSFDARRRIMDLDPRHERMIEVARSHGAAANYAGSGGAIVGIRPKDWDALRSALEADGCAVLRLRTPPRGGG
jgi:glucuronokinase